MRIASAVGVLLAVALLAAAPLARGDDDLPRKGAWLGVRFAPAPPGTVVEQVLPGGTGERWGLAAGDRILRLGAVETADRAALGAAIRTLVPGAEAEVVVDRGGAQVAAKAVVAAWPMASYPDFEVSYGQVVLREGVRLRTIVTRPKGEGPFPAVLVVQGLGPASMDAMPGSEHPYARFAEAATRAGFVTMRVEKPGVGDSEGGPHEEVDFATETLGFQRGLEALVARREVDRARVFLWGHSMGGVMAPILAQAAPLRGIAVYGTTGLTWIEYCLANNRRQALLNGWTHAAVDRLCREIAGYLSAVYLEGRDTAAAFAAFPGAGGGGFGAEPRHYGKTVEFFRQLARTNLAEAWERVDTDVLVVWGEGDFVSGPEDHRAVADAVNAAHAGRASYRTLPDCDHGFRRAADPAASHGAGRGGPALPPNEAWIPFFLEWMKTREVPAPKTAPESP